MAYVTPIYGGSTAQINYRLGCRPAGLAWLWFGPRSSGTGPMRRSGRCGLVVEQVYDHHSNVGMNTTPILVFDAWEHAYYLQYRNVRPDYVQKLWNLVNWTDVTRRFNIARTGTTDLCAPAK